MENNKIVTADLSEFSTRELKEASELLKAYAEEGADFLSDGLTLNFNKNSGYIFLCDNDYNTAMMNGEDLEQWFNCPVCGHEGFLQDMKHECEEEGIDYLIEIGALSNEEAMVYKL